MARPTPPQPATPLVEPQPVARERLSRRRVLEAALAYVDEHGLDALTMRKLGAVLGVEGTALYNHVQGKDGLLDGLVELFWSEAHALTDTSGAWQDTLRSLAAAVREVTRRHQRAAPLICSRSVMPIEALELFGACLSRLEEAGFERRDAAQAVCVLSGHAFGYAIMELSALGSWAGDDAPESEAQRIRRVAQMLPPDVSDDLFEVGLAVCGCDTNAQFAVGVDLIIGGLRPKRRRR